MTFSPNRCIDSPPTAASSVEDATTRSCCAVTRATRAFTSSCCALRTSSVVRCPTRASSRTPLSAIFGGVDLRRGCLDLRLGGIQLSPALHTMAPGAALINRDRELSQNRDVRLPQQ